MTNAMSVISAISAPNPIADYLNAFRTGQALATEVRSSGASASRPTDPGPDELLALDGPQRAQAARRADLLHALGIGLSGMPYSLRTPILAHLAPALSAEGVPLQVVTDFDPTDEALASSIAQARAAGELLTT